MAFAIRLILSFLPKDKIVIWAIAAIVAPFIIINLLFASPVVIAKRVPLVNPMQARMYFQAALDVSNKTESPCHSGVNVNWQEVIAVDAARLRQNFNGVSYSRARGLAEMFIEQIGT